MLRPLAPLLVNARDGGYAVGTFTVFDFASARGVFEAIERARVPIGLAVTRRMTTAMDLEGLAAYIVSRASASDVDIALHLDHATDLDLVERALAAGFTSVQYDGPALAMPERIEMTRKAVELARAYGASMESELDHIGRTGVEVSGDLTDPHEAAAFVAATGVDILAVSVGTTHGLAEGEAHLDFDRIAAIRAATPVHLALHGGTGVAPDELTAAIRAGMTKVSYFHGMAHDALNSLRIAVADAPHGMLATVLDEAIRPAFRDRCLEMLERLGDPGRAAGAV
jgi:fructose-bisphosphate aldolase class II